MFFHKFLECCSIWLKIDGEHRNAAWSENVKNLKAGSIEYANFSHHRDCYSASNELKCGVSVRKKRKEVDLLTLKKKKRRLLTPKSVAAAWKRDHVPGFPLTVFPVFCVRLNKMVLKFKTSGLRHRLGCMFDISTCGHCNVEHFLNCK